MNGSLYLCTSYEWGTRHTIDLNFPFSDRQCIQSPCVNSSYIVTWCIVMTFNRMGAALDTRHPLQTSLVTSGHSRVHFQSLSWSFPVITRPSVTSGLKVTSGQGDDVTIHTLVWIDPPSHSKVSGPATILLHY